MLPQTENVWKKWQETPSQATLTGSKRWLHMESSNTRTDADIREKRHKEYLLLKELHEKSRYIDKKDNPFGIFDEKIQMARVLEKEGFCKVNSVIHRATRDPVTGVFNYHNTEPDPDSYQVELLPKGIERITKTKTRTETKTTTETTQVQETLEQKETKRNLMRTERGNAILTMVPEALVSDVRSHIQAVRNPETEYKERRSHKIWLGYELRWRWNDIPEPLRHEAEDCRDLPIKPPTKKTTKKPTET